MKKESPISVDFEWLKRQYDEGTAHRAQPGNVLFSRVVLDGVPVDRNKDGDILAVSVKISKKRYVIRLEHLAVAIRDSFYTKSAHFVQEHNNGPIFIELWSGARPSTLDGSYRNCSGFTDALLTSLGLSPAQQHRKWRETQRGTAKSVEASS